MGSSAWHPKFLEKYFEKRWGIAKNKAKFLARNESNLAMSTVMAQMWKERGVTHFKWGHSVLPEPRRRDSHKKLYNNIYAIDNPPIIDEELGIKGLPRQIWNCECQFIPVFPSDKKLKELTNVKGNAFKEFAYKVKNSTQRTDYSWRYRRFGQRKEV